MDKLGKLFNSPLKASEEMEPSNTTTVISSTCDTIEEKSLEQSVCLPYIK